MAELPVDALPSEPNPAALPASARRQVAPSLTSFVGRERELAEIRTFLDAGARLITLTGAGGVGKTRLALRLADLVEQDFSGALLVVALAHVADPKLVPLAVARAAGVREAADRDITERLADAFAGQNALVVIDNFEHVVEAAPVLAELLMACPGLRFVVTSRVPLHISGEQIYPVAPLELPAPAGGVEAVAQAPAARLFVERAKAADPSFALTDQNAAAVAGVCGRLDGLPLAIELAAAKVGFLTPSALLGRLDRRLPVLIGGSRDQPARLRTMRDAIAWSYDLLPAEAQALFRRLAVFAGGFTLPAAQAVAGPAAGGDDLFPLIETLAEQSLITRLDAPAGGPRFGMLETVREYGLEQLAGSGELEEIRSRHAAWCLALAEEAEPHLEGFGGDQARWLALLDAEWGNLAGAVDWFTESGDARSLLRMVAVLDVYWFSRPYLELARDWLEWGLAAAVDVPADIRGMALHVLVNLDCSLGRMQQALARATEELELARQQGADFPLGRAHFGLGLVHETMGEAERAEEEYASAAHLLRCAGARSWVYLALAGEGRMRLAQGDITGAVPRLDEAVALVRQADPADPDALNDTLSVSIVLGSRAHAACVQGDQPLAGRLYGEAIDAARSLRADRFVIAHLAGLAGVAHALGKQEPAARLLGAVAAAQEAEGMALGANAAQITSLAAALRARLGPERFERLFTAGRTVPLDEAVAEGLALTSPDARRPAPGGFGLTRRERDVLGLLVEGKTDREIAEILFLSRRTVTTHTSSLFAKLNVSSRTEAAARAIRLGLV